MPVILSMCCQILRNGELLIFKECSLATKFPWRLNSAFIAADYAGLGDIEGFCSFPLQQLRPLSPYLHCTWVKGLASPSCMYAAVCRKRNEILDRKRTLVLIYIDQIIGPHCPKLSVHIAPGGGRALK